MNLDKRDNEDEHKYEAVEEDNLTSFITSAPVLNNRNDSDTQYSRLPYSD